MGKRHSLPESLELLLDTMCNTFGGIMFIAISLIIISQLVAKDFKRKTPEEINRKEIARLEERTAKLRNEIAKLKQQALALRFNVADASPEKSAVLKKLRDAAAGNLVLQEELDKANQQSVLLNARLQKSQQECRNAAREVSRERQIQRRELMKLEAQKRQQQLQTGRMQRELQQIVPKTFSFAMESSTYLRPYWIIVHKNRIYRMDRSDECERLAIGERSFRVVPKQGVPLEQEGDAVMGRIFDSVDKGEYFISLVSDESSFAAMKQLRYYLRRKGFKVHWWIDGEYRFSYGSVNYSASD